MQSRQRLSPKTMANPRVLDGCPTNRLNDVKHRQVAPLVTPAVRRDPLNVVELDHMIPLRDRGDLNLNSYARSSEQGNYVRVSRSPYFNLRRADFLQHMSEQALGTIAESAVTNLRPEFAQQRSDLLTISQQALSLALGPGE